MNLSYLELSLPTTPIPPAPPTLSSQQMTLFLNDHLLTFILNDLPQSPSIIQISKKIKLPNNTLNLDYVINTDNENNTYIC